MLKIRVDSNVTKLFNSKRKALGGGSTKAVQVGYVTPYAYYVHQGMPRDISPQHDDPTKDHFLRGTARELTPEIVNIVGQEIAKGSTVLQALYKAGALLLKEVDQYVPVDTGELVQSGFVEPEDPVGLE